MQVVAALAGTPMATMAPTNTGQQTIQGAYLAALVDPTANSTVNITQQPTNKCVILQPAAPPALQRTMLAADFAVDSGGFWVTNFPSTNAVTLPPGPWTWSEVTGWSCFDREACEPYYGPYGSMLVTPPMTVPNTGGVKLSFKHRYNGEAGGWDGGLLLISVNGGNATAVPAAYFTSNGYNGIITGNTIGPNRYKNFPAFVDTSEGYATPAYITSEVILGSFNRGDVIMVGFLYSWDDGCAAAAPNWEINSAQVDFGTAVPVTATLQMNASGTSYPAAGPYNTSITPSYQWQKNSGAGFVNIPGAIARTYTTPFVTMADNGTQFRCVATIPGASALTQTPTMTVIAACGLASVTHTEQGIDIVWNSLATADADWCQLQAATTLVPRPGVTAWVTVLPGDPDVLVFEKGHVVLKHDSVYKFFCTKAPVACP
jgi:hypothetical protein